MSVNNSVALQAQWLAAKDDQIRALTARVRVLEEALRFYADKPTYYELVTIGNGVWSTAIGFDKGERARKALSGEEG